MSLFAGLKEELMIWLCGDLQSNMQLGYTIASQTAYEELLLWSFLPRQKLIVETYFGHMYGDARCLSLIQNSNMERRYPRGRCLCLRRTRMFQLEPTSVQLFESE
eukprot:CCRYP_000302-RB/>CCRYP_000302-RB protein AED:0.39 eAED:0.22 QI:0/-1/0/1/-1/0/1/0/104